MADQRKDVQLDIAVSTSGSDDIRKLSQDVRQLAKDGGSAAPEFQRLAAELDRIASQVDAVQTFAQLQEEIRQLSAAQADAVGNANRLEEELRQLSESTQRYAAAETQARGEVRAASDNLNQKRDALARLKLEYDDAQKATDSYKQRVKALNVEILDGKIALRDKKAALADAAEGTVAAERAEDSLAKKYRSASREAQRATDEVKQRNEVLRESGAALEAAGLSTNDLVEAQAKLRVAFANARAQIDQQQTALVQLAEQQAQAAEEARRAAREEERLAVIVENSKKEQLRLGQEQLAAERAAATEAEALSRRLADQQQAAARQRLADLKEEDRLLAIVEANKVKAAQRAQQELAAEARAQSEALANARRYEQQKVDAARQAQEEIRAQAQRTAQALDDTFKRTGVRSAAAIRDEINTIGAALVRLRGDASVTGAEFDRAFASGNARIKKLQDELAGIEPATRNSTKSINLMSSAFRELAATYGVIELSQKFIEANVQIETLRRSLTLITGSTEKAAQSIRFLQDTANRTGQSIGEITDAFVRFTASTVNSGVALETSQAIFESVSNAAGQLGLSTQRTGLVLDALGQIANKGKVSLEELQGQLGESLPGALSIVAKGLGVTTKQLTALVEQGKLLSEDFFPAFQRGMQESFGAGEQQINSFQATFNRLKNSFTEFSQILGDTGALDALGGALRAFGVAVGAIFAGLSLAADGLFTTIRAGATVVAGVVNGDLNGALTRSAELYDEAIKRQTRLGEVLQVLAGVRDADTAASQRSAAATLSAAQAQVQAAAGAQTNATAQTAAAGAATANASAQGQAGTAAAAAGTAAAVAGNSWTALQVSLIENTKAADQNTKNAKTLADAKKLEGDVTKQLAEIVGDETQIRAAAVTAAQGYAQALDNVAKKAQEEANVQIAARTALEAEIGGRENASAAKRKELEDLDKLIVAKQAEADKAKQAAQDAQLEAAAREAAAAAYRDNAASLDTLRTAATDAAAALERLRAANNGTPESLAAVRDAEIKAAQAASLYRDALNDQAAALERRISRIQTDQDLTLAGLNLERARAQAALDVAQSTGNEALALDAKIRLKEIEVKVIQANVDAARAEAKAILAAVEAERAALVASGGLTEAKKAELDARLANAKVKQLEADASAEALKGINAEIERLRVYGDASVSARTSSAKAIDSETAAIRRNIAAQEEQRGIDTNPTTRNARVTQESQDSDAARRATNRTAADNTGFGTLFDKLAKGTLTADDLALAQGVFNAAKNNLQVVQQNGTAVSSSGYRSALEDFNKARRALEQLQGASISGTGGGGTDNKGGSSTKTVNINIGGRRSSIDVASSADADALVELLRQLEDASKRS